MIPEVKKDTTVEIDYLPATGTRITMAGQVRGKDIEGVAFFEGLLKIWLGERPVQADLKSRLLGQ